MSNAFPPAPIYAMEGRERNEPAKASPLAECPKIERC